MIISNSIRCVTCKHYEFCHQYPNPLAFATHYCKKCNDEIYCNKNGSVFIPKGCYFNDYYEESEESKKKREARYTVGWACYQTED